MAFSFLPTTPISSFNGVRHPSLVPQRLSSTKIHTHKLVQCVSSSMSKLKSDSETVVRRSANYQPCIWDDVYVQSLDNLYKVVAIINLIAFGSCHPPYRIIQVPFLKNR